MGYTRGYHRVCYVTRSGATQCVQRQGLGDAPAPSSASLSQITASSSKGSIEDLKLQINRFSDPRASVRVWTTDVAMNGALDPETVTRAFDLYGKRASEMAADGDGALWQKWNQIIGRADFAASEATWLSSNLGEVTQTIRTYGDLHNYPPAKVSPTSLAVFAVAGVGLGALILFGGKKRRR